MPRLEMVCKLTALVCRFRWTPISATMLENIGAICGPLVDPPADPDATARAREILRLLFRHRRIPTLARRNVGRPPVMKCATTVWSLTFR